ncbi:MAG TPA: hypothetical protein VIE65_09445 [Methylobacter sp.]|jgi:hypothetical protein
MDDTFFQELDKHVSNIGTDRIWKRKIGDRLVWFSPVDFSGEAKTWDKIVSEEENALRETKRLALSNSIVGFDDYDLRKWRYAGPTFPMEGKDDKGNTRTIKVDLPKYIYSKIAHWDAAFVDTAYRVFADLMASHEKFLTQEITFENLKSPMEELSELELRIATLRDELGLPQLVAHDKINSEATEDQADPDADIDDEEQFEAASSINEEYPEENSLIQKPVPPYIQNAERSSVAFNPFETHPLEEPGLSDQPVRSIPVPIPPSKQSSDLISNLSPIERERLARANKRSSIPSNVPVIPDVNQKVASRAAPTNTPDTAYVGLPSVEKEVIERSAERTVVDPPKFDKRSTSQSINPRFQRPGSG